MKMEEVVAVGFLILALIMLFAALVLFMVMTYFSVQTNILINIF